MSTSSRPVIGIYVGTKRTQYAVDTEIVSGRPSYAVFTEEGWKIGVPKRLNPSTIMELNRLIGKMWYDGTIIADMERWPFKVAGDNRKKAIIQVTDSKGESSSYYPEIIYALMLRNAAKSAAEANISFAVIAVPASFNEAQRRAIRDAALIAGFTTVRLINNTAAAAIAYVFDTKYATTDGKDDDDEAEDDDDDDDEEEDEVEDDEDEAEDDEDEAEDDEDEAEDDEVEDDEDEAEDDEDEAEDDKAEAEDDKAEAEDDKAEAEDDGDDDDEEEDENNQNLLIFSLGSGCFNASIISVSEDDIFTVIASQGDSHLGGIEFDSQMVKFVVRKFNEDWDQSQGPGSRPHLDESCLQKIRMACEVAKVRLSSKESTDITVPCLGFTCQITRSEFNIIIRQLVFSAIDLTKKAMQEASLTKSDLHRVLLVGCSCRIPYIQDILNDLFDDTILMGNFDVARGAEILGKVALQKGRWDMLYDIFPFNFGLSTPGRATVSPITKRISDVPSPEPIRFVYQDPSRKKRTELFIQEGSSRNPSKNKVVTKITIDRGDFGNQSEAVRGPISYAINLSFDVNGILEIQTEVIARPDIVAGTTVSVVHLDGRMSEEEIEAARTNPCMSPPELDAHKFAVRVIDKHLHVEAEESSPNQVDAGLEASETVAALEEEEEEAAASAAKRLKYEEVEMFTGEEKEANKATGEQMEPRTLV